MEDVTEEQEQQLEKKDSKKPRKKKVEKVDLKPYIDNPDAMDGKVETTDGGKTLVQKADEV